MSALSAYMFESELRIVVFDRRQQKMLHLVVWRGRSTINIMACKADVATLMNCMKALGLYQATSDEKEQSENLGSINDSKTCGESAPIAPVQSPADKE